MKLQHLAIGRSDLFKVDPHIIVIEDDFNQRRNFGDLDALGKDIAANGLTHPLIVRVGGEDKSTIYLVDGERRLRAIRREIEKGADIPTVSCRSEGANVKPLDRLFLQLSANTGKPFSLAEKGRVYLAMLAQDPSLTASEISRRTPYTKQAISNALKLVNKGTDRLLKAVDAGVLSATTALQIIDQSHTPQQQEEILADALDSAAKDGRQSVSPKHLPSKGDPGKPENQEQESPQEETPPPPADSTPPPPDPGAIDRIKNAPDTNRDGSPVGPGNNSSGFAKPDQQLLKLDKIMDGIDRSTCLADRLTTTEVILRFLHGEADARRVKSHLQNRDA